MYAVSTSSAAARRTESDADFGGVSTLDEASWSPVVAIAAPRPAVRFIGRDPKVLDLLELVNKVAATTATVLITGESGTGKELIARMICECSARNRHNLVAVNCGAIPESLQESEFFGHLKGAFTGANRRKIGKLELANGGTIFLDEIGEMSRSLQVALLRTLQSGEYSPVGSAETRFCDVRVIAAASRNLLDLVEAGNFRQDLFYRLNIIHIEIPALRERRGDLPLLCEHFLRVLSEKHQTRQPTLSNAAREILYRYDYPGNVRQLENILRRAVIVCGGPEITPEHLSAEVRKAPVALIRAEFLELEDFQTAKARSVEDFERSYLAHALRIGGGIVARAAARSGLSERNFHEKLKRYGIHARDFRKSARSDDRSGE